MSHEHADCRRGGKTCLIGFSLDYGFYPFINCEFICHHLDRPRSAHVCQPTSSADHLGPSLRELKSGERCCKHLHPSLSCEISPERAAGVDPDSLVCLSSGPMGVDPVSVEDLPPLASTVQIMFCLIEHAVKYNGPLEALNCNRCLP